MAHPDGHQIANNEQAIREAYAEHERAYSTFMNTCRDVLSGLQVADKSELEQLARNLEEKFNRLREAWGIAH